MKNIEKLDTVTGLPIYDSFIGIAREELANNFVPGHYVLIATDISNFKYINHIYGYSKANELLRDLIALISNSVDGNVSTCRTHSDHIISLLNITEIRRHFAAVWTDTAGILLKIITENILQLCFTLTMVYFLLINIMMI